MHCCIDNCSDDSFVSRKLSVCVSVLSYLDVMSCKVTFSVMKGTFKYSVFLSLLLSTLVIESLHNPGLQIHTVIIMKRE